MRVTLLDGPLGTELARRGVRTPTPLWSAGAVETSPEVVAAIHADYAAAGAWVHTANTFRTDSWTLAKVGRADDCEDLSRRAVEIARASVPDDHLVAGSISPLEDCYEPSRSPPLAVCREEHRRSARALVEAGVDLLLCETFPHPGEALAALDAALEHNVPTWLSLTPGPDGGLLSDEEIVETLREAARRGAEAVLVNCAAPKRLTQILPRLAELDLQFGAYGNVGRPCSEAGWVNEGEALPQAYVGEVLRWLEGGATILGGCCGTGPQHIEAVDRLVKNWSCTGDKK